jgi:uncharacterized protein (TIGR00304 family)
MYRYRLRRKERLADATGFFAVGLALIFVGILMIVLAALLLSVRSAKKQGKGKVSAGGAVIIGPIPIIFGTDKKALKTVLLLSLSLTILLLVVMVVYYLLLR